MVAVFVTLVAMGLAFVAGWVARELTLKQRISKVDLEAEFKAIDDAHDLPTQLNSRPQTQGEVLQMIEERRRREAGR